MPVASPGATSAPVSSAHARPPRIGLLGPYSSRNLGDTATQLTVIRQLQSRLGEVSFVGISPEPADTVQSLGISAFPLYGEGTAAGRLPTGVDARLRPRWRAMLRLVAQLDLLVVSGGGQFDDFWGGPWVHPWTMLMWTACARLRGVPVSYLGVGVDHLHHPLSRRFSVLALRLAQQRTFREADSLAQLQSMGLAAATQVCPDVVFALEVPPRADADAPFAVLSPISQKTWSKEPTPIHARYLESLSDAAATLAAQGLQIRIAVTQPAMDANDARLLAAALCKRGVNGVSLVPVTTVDDYLRAVSGAHLVVASRLHAVILALIAGRPVVALSHLPKVERVMRDAALGEYCLPLQLASTEQLDAIVRRASASTLVLQGHVQAANLRFRTQLASTFDALSKLLGD